MSKGPALLFILFILTLSVFGQDDAPYSQDTALKRILAAEDDSSKILKLDQYSYAFEDTDKEKYLKINDEIFRLARKLDYPYWIGMAWFNLGYIDSKDANDRDAISHFDSAVFYLQRTDRVDKMAYCHLNMAALWGRLGNINEKVRNLNEAIRLLENTSYVKPLIHVYNSMGVLFFNQEDFDKGFQYFEKGMQSARQTKDTSNLVEALHGMVNCLSSQKQFEKAIRCGDELMAIANKAGKDFYFLHAHTALSELYRKWGKSGPALEHAGKIVKYAKSTRELQYELIGLMGIADGKQLAKDYRGSIEYYNRALKLGEEKEVVIQLDDIYKGLSDAYLGLNDQGRALDFYKKYILYRDSANNEKIKQNSAELEIKYQTAEREKALSQNQLQLAQKDLQLQKSQNYMYYTLAALIFASLTAALLYLRWRFRKVEHAREIQSIQQQKELQLLQALMQGEERERGRIAKDLHDGVAGMLAAVKMHFSSMPSADQLAQTEGYRQGMKLLNEATSEIRKTSHNLMPEVLLQHGLDVALSRYCNNISNSRSLQIQYDSWGDSDRFAESFELSVYRMVQELMNNIIKHSNATRGIVQYSQQNDVLSISIEDNGVGLRETDGQGMGLQSLQQRIKAMNGKMELESSAENGVAVYLEFDVSTVKRISVLS